MELLILPLLIASNQYSQNLETWTEGPRLYFNVTYHTFVQIKNMSTNGQDSSVESTLKASLGCQFKNVTYMHCHIINPKMIIGAHESDASGGTITSLDHPEFSTAYNNMMLDLKFNKFGLEDLKVSESKVSDKMYDELRTLLYPFHTGIDLATQKVGSFDLPDNFVTGECLTHYEMQLDVFQSKFEFGKPIRIHKKTQMDQCKKKVDNFYLGGLRYYADGIPLTANIESFESSIEADSAKYISSTKTEMTLNPNGDHSEQLHATTEVKIVYDSVEPATHHFHTIQDGKSIGVIYGDHLSAESMNKPVLNTTQLIDMITEKLKTLQEK